LVRDCHPGEKKEKRKGDGRPSGNLSRAIKQRKKGKEKGSLRGTGKFDTIRKRGANTEKAKYWLGMGWS